MKNLYGIFIVVIFLAICYGNPINDNIKRDRRQAKDMNISTTMMQASRQFQQPINPIQGTIPGLQGTIPGLQGAIPGLYPGNGYQVGYQPVPTNNGFYPLPGNIYPGNIYGNTFMPPNIDPNQLNAAINFANLPGLNSQNFQQQLLQPGLTANPFIGPTFPQQPYLG